MTPISLKLLDEIRGCTACADNLPHGPRPVLNFGSGARVAIIGQAPGRRVHESGVAWDDPSGERLRDWTGIPSDAFYDGDRVALIPMGFCYPGAGKGGDLPPRPECAPLWHDRVFASMPSIRLTLLVGAYAQAAYLGDIARRTLTETVQAWREAPSDVIPLPHPSPRNNIWLKKNPWFASDLLPHLRAAVASALAS